MIDRNILIEDLVHEYPDAVELLMCQGIKCMACGEPLWGTLEQAAHERGFSDEKIDHLAAEINAMVRKKAGKDHAHSHR